MARRSLALGFVAGLVVIATLGSADLLLGADKAPAQAEVRTKAPSTNDAYRAAMAAAARGKYDQAADLLKQIPSGNPRYAKAQALLAYQIYGEALRRPKDGLPYATNAYAAAPSDPDVAIAYLKTHVLAGVLFDPKSIARERPKTVPKEFAFLVTKPQWEGDAKKLPRAKLEADLDYLEHILANCFAYLELRPVNYRAALDAIHVSLEDETSLRWFELCLAKLIPLFCDGHAALAVPSSRYLPSGYAPFMAGSYSNRVFLIEANGTNFLDPAHPYLTAIDGRPIADWLNVAGYLVVKESAQWHQRGALSMLEQIAYLRTELGLPASAAIRLSLESADRRSHAKREVAVQPKRPRHARFPRGDSRRIGDIGYLRLASMTSSERVLTDLNEWMTKFRDTKGLILDVRGNTGGTKSILDTLFPYFMKPGAPMRIVEATTYRLPMKLPHPNPAGFGDSPTSGAPIGSPRWKTEAQRQLVAAFLRDFHPEWNPPRDKFSEWHVLGLDAADNPKAYYYDKPIVVLQDSSTFSAGDIFVGAFEDHPNTVQIGTPTGGGNGKMEDYRLPNSKLSVILCWSAKFRPNGKLYDGEGIPPDVYQEATPEDLLGRTDTVLDAAVRRLQGPTTKQ